MHLPQFTLVDKKVGSWDVPEVTVKDRDLIVSNKKPSRE